MCSEQTNTIHSRMCVMCQRRVSFARLFCEFVYNVCYRGVVSKYRAKNAVVCAECWYIHAVDISAGYYGRCVKQEVGV